MSGIRGGRRVTDKPGLDSEHSGLNKSRDSSGYLLNAVNQLCTPLVVVSSVQDDVDQLREFLAVPLRRKQSCNLSLT